MVESTKPITINEPVITRKNEDMLLLNELFSECNLSSPYCLITPIEHKAKIEDLRGLIGGFVIIIEKRVNAGLPSDSLLDSIRRLLIILSRNQNISKIVLIRSGNEKELGQIYKTIGNLKNFDDRDWEKIYLRSRMQSYGIKKDVAKKIFSRIESIESFEIDRLHISDLEEKIVEEIYSRNLRKVKLLDLDRSNSFKPYPIRKIDCKLLGNGEFSGFADLFNYAEGVLMCSGEIGKDLNELPRIQLKEQFYGKIKRSENPKKTSKELEKFLKNQGIMNSSEIYENCIHLKGFFSSRIYGPRKTEKNNIYINYEHFITRLKDAIKNCQSCYSQTLHLVTEEDGLLIETQIGWESITPHLSIIDGDFIISFTHTLRSVDLYDGMPFNLYFSYDFSKEIVKNLESQLVEEGLRINIKLGYIEFAIKHLHAYLDSVPIEVIKSRGGWTRK